jgi:hypothetical protein
MKKKTTKIASIDLFHIIYLEMHTFLFVTLYQILIKKERDDR